MQWSYPRPRLLCHFSCSSRKWIHGSTKSNFRQPLLWMYFEYDVFSVYFSLRHLCYGLTRASLWTKRSLKTTSEIHLISISLRNIFSRLRGTDAFTEDNKWTWWARRHIQQWKDRENSIMVCKKAKHYSIISFAGCVASCFLIAILQE